MNMCNSSWEVVANFTGKYYLPGMLFVGLLSNALCLLVFLGTKLRRMPAARYLISLAVVDFGALLVQIITQIGGAPMLMISNLTCQIFVYFYAVFCTLSVWFVVGFTVERFIAVRFPLKWVKFIWILGCI